MSSKYFTWWTYTWCIGFLISCFIDGVYINAHGGDFMIGALTGYNTSTVIGDNIWTIPNLLLGFFTQGISRLILWDFSFLQGDGFNLVRAMFVVIFSPGLILGLVSIFKAIFSVR